MSVDDQQRMNPADLHPKVAEWTRKHHPERLEGAVDDQQLLVIRQRVEAGVHLPLIEVRALLDRVVALTEETALLRKEAVANEGLIQRQRGRVAALQTALRERLVPEYGEELADEMIEALPEVTVWPAGTGEV